MKKIKLSQNKFAIIDNEDFEKINKYKWSLKKDGYTSYAITGKKVGNGTYLMHRFIMNTPKGMLVDHKDGNGLNNRKNNLRNCTITENNRNRGKDRTNSSGFKGIYKPKKRNVWRARISFNNKKIHIGYFKTKEEAYKAYCIKSKELHGEFANFG